MSDDKSGADPAVIEMKGVSVGSFHRPGSTVLEQVDWTVRRGQFWVVAGHHGSGKSDLLMTLAGLMGPLEGSYRLLGVPMPIFEDSQLAARLKVGLVFHGGQLLNQLTVGENVELPLRYHRDTQDSGRRQRAVEVIETLELGPWVDQLPGRVGREWQQRAGLARALMLEPELLLLDDPLSGLDARHSQWWVNLLNGLCRGGHAIQRSPLTLVVGTDTLAPWRRVATHCGLLEDGRLLTMGCLGDAEVRQHARVREYLEHGRWAFDPSP